MRTVSVRVSSYCSDMNFAAIEQLTADRRRSLEASAAQVHLAALRRSSGPRRRRPWPAVWRRAGQWTSAAAPTAAPAPAPAPAPAVPSELVFAQGARLDGGHFG